MHNEFDISLLQQAARLAVNGHGTAEPNPLVGCIITNNKGEIVGDGYHEQFGEAHAEITALKKAGNQAIGGTAYITLEPCNHHGKTPPCSHALLQSNIKRVVIGVRDPHPVASGGAEFLRSNGVDVEIVNNELCNEIIAPFEHRIKTKLPWITCKWAQTIDGCIETPENDSPWISCEESQQLVHEERCCVDAIVVGVGTVIADNPTLTARGVTKHRTPIRVVIDPSLRTPGKAKVLNDDAPTLLAHAQSADISSYATCNLLSLPSQDSVLKLEPLFRHLVENYDATNVLVEGGAKLFQHLFTQQLVNEIWRFTSPNLSNITPAINMNSLIKTLTTTLVDEQPCGEDTVARLIVTP